MTNKLKPLVLGDLKINIPIIQGGMGVKVSTASLAIAVANCAAAGTIASVGLGLSCMEKGGDYFKVSRESLRYEMKEAKKGTNGVVGVNVMVALGNYEDLVRTAAEEKADFIVSGAGLPLKLPEYAENRQVKLIPIVSSGRAADIIIKTWKKRYNRLPDAIVVEGPLAGGHLGFSFEEVSAARANALEELVKDVLNTVEEYQKRYNAYIPVIAAGGVYDGADIARFIKLGASGVQMGTRFVVTDECAVPDKFKQMYIEATEDDVVIIKSPVGMPGRALKNSFIERMFRNERDDIKCFYRCLRSCSPNTVPYCIARKMFDATDAATIDDAVVFAGANVARVDRVMPVKELIDELVKDAEAALI